MKVYEAPLLLIGGVYKSVSYIFFYGLLNTAEAFRIILFELYAG